MGRKHPKGNVSRHHLYLGAGGILAAVALVTAVAFGFSSAQTMDQCPSGMTGTPPNCVSAQCPTDMTGTPPNCVSAQCPTGMTGTPPNCVSAQVTCPNGTNHPAPYTCAGADNCGQNTTWCPVENACKATGTTCGQNECPQATPIRCPDNSCKGTQLECSQAGGTQDPCPSDTCPNVCCNTGTANYGTITIESACTTAGGKWCAGEASPNSCFSPSHTCMTGGTQCPTGQFQCPAVGTSPAGCYSVCPTVGTQNQCPAGTTGTYPNCTGSQTCPASTPFRCPNNTCVLTQILCGQTNQGPASYTTQGLCEAATYKWCTGGQGQKNGCFPSGESCTTTTQQTQCGVGYYKAPGTSTCVIQPTCASNQYFDFNSGACTPNTNTQVQCPSSKPILCGNGTCATTQAECTSTTNNNQQGTMTCPNGAAQTCPDPMNPAMMICPDFMTGKCPVKCAAGQYPTATNPCMGGGYQQTTDMYRQWDSTSTSTCPVPPMCPMGLRQDGMDEKNCPKYSCNPMATEMMRGFDNNPAFFKGNETGCKEKRFTWCSEMQDCFPAGQKCPKAGTNMPMAAPIMDASQCNPNDMWCLQMAGKQNFNDYQLNIDQNSLKSVDDRYNTQQIKQEAMNLKQEAKGLKQEAVQIKQQLDRTTKRSSVFCPFVAEYQTALTTLDTAISQWENIDTKNPDTLKAAVVLKDQICGVPGQPGTGISQKLYGYWDDKAEEQVYGLHRKIGQCEMLGNFTRELERAIQKVTEMQTRAADSGITTVAKAYAELLAELNTAKADPIKWSGVTVEELFSVPGPECFGGDPMTGIGGLMVCKQTGRPQGFNQGGMGGGFGFSQGGMNGGFGFNQGGMGGQGNYGPQGPMMNQGGMGMGGQTGGSQGYYPSAGDQGFNQGGMGMGQGGFDGSQTGSFQGGMGNMGPGSFNDFGFNAVLKAQADDEDLDLEDIELFDEGMPEEEFIEPEFPENDCMPGVDKYLMRKFGKLMTSIGKIERQAQKEFEKKGVCNQFQWISKDISSQRVPENMKPMLEKAKLYVAKGVEVCDAGDYDTAKKILFKLDEMKREAGRLGPGLQGEEVGFGVSDEKLLEDRMAAFATEFTDTQLKAIQAKYEGIIADLTNKVALLSETVSKLTDQLAKLQNVDLSKDSTAVLNNVTQLPEATQATVVDSIQPVLAIADDASTVLFDQKKLSKSIETQFETFVNSVVTNVPTKTVSEAIAQEMDALVAYASNETDKKKIETEVKSFIDTATTIMVNEKPEDKVKAGTAAFVDSIDMRQWFAPRAFEWKSDGIVQGNKDGQLQAGKEMNNAEMACMVANGTFKSEVEAFVRAHDATNPVPPVPGVNAGSLTWALPCVHILVNHDVPVTDVFEGALNAPMQRRNAAELVYEVKKDDLGTFKPENIQGALTSDVPATLNGDEKEALAVLRTAGIMEGKQDGQFLAPMETLRKGEGATLVQELLGVSIIDPIFNTGEGANSIIDPIF